MGYRSGLVLLALMLPSLGAAQGIQTLSKELVSPAANSNLLPGASVQYRITAACNSLTGSCGELRIGDINPAVDPAGAFGPNPALPNFGSVSSPPIAPQWPPELEIVSCVVPGGPANIISGSCNLGSSGFVYRRNPFNDGDTLDLTINARVRLTAPPTSGVTNRAVSQIALPQTLPNTRVAAVSQPINIIAGIPLYEVRKQRIDPPIAFPIADVATIVRYQIQFCAVTGLGNVPLTSPVVVRDVLPAGATFVSASSPVGSFAGSGGGPIDWTIPAGDLALDGPNFYGNQSDVNQARCLSATLTISLPAGVANVLNTVTWQNGTSSQCQARPAGVRPGVGANATPCTASTNDPRGAPAATASLNKSGNDATPGGAGALGQIRWNVAASTAGNVPVTDFQVVDTVPGAPSLTVSEIYSGTWDSGAALGYQVLADIYRSTVPSPDPVCGGPGWTVVQLGATGASNQTFTAGLPATLTFICWRFRNNNTGPGLPPANEVPRGFGFGSAGYLQPVPSGTPLGTITNCISASFATGSGPGSAGPICRTQNIEGPTVALRATKQLVNPPAQIRPGDELTFRIGAEHVLTDSTAPLVNPVISDLLPAAFEFIQTQNPVPAVPAPTVTVIPNFGGSGRTLVRAAFTGSFPVGPGGPRIEILGRIPPGTPNGLYSNDSAAQNGGNPYTCEVGTGIPDTTPPADWDGNPATTERCFTSTVYTVVEAAVLGGEKWVQGSSVSPLVVDDPTDTVTPPGGVCPDYGQTFFGTPDNYTRFPCVARTEYGVSFNYRIRVQNVGNVPLTQYLLADVLPFVGDTGVGQPLSTTARDTRWQPRMSGPIVIEENLPGANVIIEYSGSNNACRQFLSNSTDITTDWQGGCVNDWSTTPPGGNFANVRAFRIRAFEGGGGWAPIDRMVFRIPMQSPPTGAPPSVIGDPVNFHPSWGSFAHRAYRSGPLVPGNLLPTAEPRKVGIVLPERYRVGNLVWIDDDNDGVAEPGEAGVNGVTVRLCRDTDGTAGPSPGDSLLGSTTTATVAGQPGKYVFDTLLPGNNYYLAVPTGQAVLNGYQSSGFGQEGNPNLDVDNNDNGIGTTAASAGAICGGGTGWASGLITLGPSGLTEPSNERLRSGSTTVDDPNGTFDFYPNGLSNYSIDFGFFPVNDFGDLPDTGSGIGPGNYQTRLADNGARHPVRDGLRIGAVVDTENDGQPTTGADGDDNPINKPDDEEGVNVADLTMIRGTPGLVRVTVTNTVAPAAPALLCGYIDFNANGNLNDAGEAAQIAVPSGTNNAVLTLNFGTVPPGGNLSTYGRFRLSTDAVCAANGPATDGEVEDYVVTLLDQLEYGDLPDTGPGVGPGNYETLRTHGGPRHPRVTGLRLGAELDIENDGQPNVAADGDDVNPVGQPDDEDGINIADLVLTAGTVANVRAIATNTTGAAARLCGYLDLNGNGSFGDTGEIAQVAVPNGSSNANFNLVFGVVPNNAPPVTYARFRLSTAGGACAAANANGDEPDGEVEDYRVTVRYFDLGDLPDTGPGVGAGNYRTLRADNGARHEIAAPALPPNASPLRLGATVDAEGDGQPNAAADGDDGNGLVPDDEDGVNVADLTVAAGTAPSIRVNATNTTGSAARLCGYLDGNGNGTFTEPGEVAQVAVPTGSNNVGFTLNFGTMPANAPNPVYARFRLSTANGACTAATAEGDEPNGEVEDYRVTVEYFDLGDLPDTGPGVGPGNYRTLRADGGARHQISAPVFPPSASSLRMGATVDVEGDGQPNAAADGDDGAGAVPDDEDGVNLADLTVLAGVAPSVRVTATNTTGAAARLCGYLDANGNGAFSEPGEVAQVAVPTGSTNVVFTLNFGTVPANAPNPVYARFRLSSASGACTAASAAGDEPGGEVEDYRVTVRYFDLGDLPDTGAGIGAGNYRTLRADGGPRHEIVPPVFPAGASPLRLGPTVDVEGDGQPNATADGDDGAGAVPDDEDGVVFQTLNLGSPGRANVSVFNNTGSSATLCAYIDWNGDGDFTDVYTITQPGGGTTRETLPAISVPSGASAQSIVVQYGIVPPPGTVGVPPGGAVLNPYARFRLTTTPGFNCVGGDSDPVAGPWPNGEVEDYRATTTSGVAIMALGNLVWEDLNNNCARDAGEPPVPGITVNLFRDSDNNGVPDGPVVATQSTNAQGEYLFQNLLPDHYIVDVVRPPRWLTSTGSGFPYQNQAAPTGCEPAPDPDNDTDNRDKGSNLNPTTIRTLPVTLEPKTEPGPPNVDTNPTVDFGLVSNFDLALNKTLAANQQTPVVPGGYVTFAITVTNQGQVPATQIRILDRYPSSLALDDPDWTPGPNNTATRVIPGPLAAGASQTVTIRFRVRRVADGATVRINRAEIESALDELGRPIRDIDSNPNNNTPGEDDQADARIDVVGITQIPVNAPWALLLMLLGVLGGGLLVGRARVAG